MKVLTVRDLMKALEYQHPDDKVIVANLRKDGMEYFEIAAASPSGTYLQLNTKAYEKEILEEGSMIVKAVVKKDDGYWSVCFLDENDMPDADIVQMFGTNILPTPYASHVEVEEVLEKIRPYILSLKEVV